MGLYSGGLIIGRIFTSEISGAYFREGLSLGGGGGGGGGYYRNFTVIIMVSSPWQNSFDIFLKADLHGTIFAYDCRTRFL